MLEVKYKVLRKESIFYCVGHSKSIELNEKHMQRRDPETELTPKVFCFFKKKVFIPYKVDLIYNYN